MMFVIAVEFGLNELATFLTLNAQVFFNLLFSFCLISVMSFVKLRVVSFYREIEWK